MLNYEERLTFIEDFALIEDLVKESLVIWGLVLGENSLIRLYKAGKKFGELYNIFQIFCLDKDGVYRPVHMHTAVFERKVTKHSYHFDLGTNQIASRQAETQTDFSFTGLLPYAFPPVSDIQPRQRIRHQNIVNDDDHLSDSTDLSSWDEDRDLEELEDILNGLL